MFKDNLRLAKNFSSLTAIQISNYLFPLIIFPYLVRVLGVENYGKVNFIIAFILYFVTFVEYGFKFSATQQIAIFKNNPNQIEKIFNSTILIKSFLCLISFIVLLIILSFFPKFGNDFGLYIIVFLFVVGNVFYTDWFFQGIEKMQYLFLVLFPVRLISTIAVFMFVKSSNDLIYYVIIISSYQFIVGLLLFIIAKTKHNIKFQFPKKYQILRQLKKGYHIFLSQISINIYTSSNVFLLGLISGNIAVGYFTGANKLREVLQGVFSNFGASVFPYFSRELLIDNQKAINSLKKYLIVILTIAFFSGLIFFIYSKEIIYLVLGDKYYNSITVLKILSFLPFIIVLSNVFGIQLMLNIGYTKEFNRIISMAALLNIILVILLVPSLKEQGAAYSILFVEIFVSVVMGIFVHKKKLLK